MKVLVTDGDYNSTVGAVRALAAAGAEPHVASPARGDLAGHSRYCFGRHVGPSAEEDAAGFASFVVELVRKEGFQVVLPVGYASTCAVADVRAAIESHGAGVPLPDAATIRKAASRRETYELALRLGVPHPRTVYPTTVEEALGLASELALPVVVKAASEVPGTAMATVRDWEAFPVAFETVAERSRVSGLLPIVQEFVQGDPCTYAVAGLYDRGRCLGVFSHYELRSYPVGGGSGACVESVRLPAEEEHAMALLDALAWHGAALVEFRRDTAGVPKLMEINPKLWASFELPLALGVNFAFHLCQLACGETVPCVNGYQAGVRFHWPLSRELGHVAQRPSAVGRWLLDCVNPCVRSNLWLRDPVPGLREAWRTARAVARLAGLGRRRAEPPQNEAGG